MRNDETLPTNRTVPIQSMRTSLALSDPGGVAKRKKKTVKKAAIPMKGKLI
jgi:hypothetical protein